MVPAFSYYAGESVQKRNAGSVDHLVPERLILKLCKGMNPHEAINLMTLKDHCHGIKTGADRRLCRGDRLGFLHILCTNNWPIKRVEAALARYGF